MATPKYMRKLKAEVQVDARPNVWIFIGRKSPAGRKKNVDETKTSIPMQKELCQKWADQRGITLIEPPAEINRVVSGRKTSFEKREDLQWALEEIKAGRARGVVAWKICRIARSLPTFREVIDTIRQIDGHVAVTDMGRELDTSTSTGRFNIYMMMLIVEWQAEMTAEMIEEKLDSLAQKGISYNHDMPFGYTKMDGLIVPHEMEQRFIAWVKRTYPKVKSIRKLEQQCSSMGFGRGLGTDDAATSSPGNTLDT